MKVLVDTCVWSRILRHKTPDAHLGQILEELIRASRVAMVGPIRQELLSGISSPVQFRKLKRALDSFEDIPLNKEHYIQAAAFSNTCRKKGIQGSSVDMLLCAVAHMEELLILTCDEDFTHFQQHLPIRLFADEPPI